MFTRACPKCQAIVTLWEESVDADTAIYAGECDDCKAEIEVTFRVSEMHVEGGKE